MKKRKKNIIESFLLIVSYVILICAVLGLSYFNYLNYDTNNQLKEEIGILREKNKELSDEIVRLEKEKEKIEKFPKEVDNIEQEQSLSLETLEVGQIVDEFMVIGSEEQYFKSYQILEGDAVYNRINGKSYYANDNISLSELRYLKLAHYNFEHKVQIGELIVNAAISEDVLNIFRELFEIEYEIQSMHLVDDYWVGDGTSSDSNSIEHNNTSAFCYREATGSGTLSNHAFGRAIDINPQQNPYVWYTEGGANWSHENASMYIDRTCGDSHVIVENDACYNIFRKYGFSWGGLWTNPIDYQHFEKKNKSKTGERWKLISHRSLRFYNNGIPFSSAVFRVSSDQIEACTSPI